MSERGVTVSGGVSFERYVSELLDENRIPYGMQTRLGGTEVDFFIVTPDWRTIVVETKSWPPEMVSRATKFARFLKNNTGADEAYVVMPHVLADRSKEGVVSASGLITSLLPKFAGVSDPERTRAYEQLRSYLQKPTANKSLFLRLNTLFASKIAKSEDVIFAAMPFSPQYDDTLFVMTEASTTVNATCKQVSREEFSTDIPKKVKELIEISVAVIADLSESNPNVLYEIGYAHALKRPTVHICSTPLDELPFDVRNENTISYNIGQTQQLKPKLVRRLRAVLKK